MKTYSSLKNAELVYRLFDEGYTVRDLVVVRIYLRKMLGKTLNTDKIIDFVKQRAIKYDERLAVTFYDLLHSATDFKHRLQVN